MALRAATTADGEGRDDVRPLLPTLKGYFERIELELRNLSCSILFLLLPFAFPLTYHISQLATRTMLLIERTKTEIVEECLVVEI